MPAWASDFANKIANKTRTPRRGISAEESVEEWLKASREDGYITVPGEYRYWIGMKIGDHPRDWIPGIDDMTFCGEPKLVPTLDIEHWCLLPIDHDGGHGWLSTCWSEYNNHLDL